VSTLAAKVGALPLEYDPGTSCKYSVATDVLGRVIEAAAERSLDEVFTERIFQPLGMVDTGSHVPADKLDRFATTYTSVGFCQAIFPRQVRSQNRSRFFSAVAGWIQRYRTIIAFC